MRIIVGITGASGAVYALQFLRRCPGEKYAVFSRWGRKVFHDETGLGDADLSALVSGVLSDADLAAPFSSGSHPFDAFVIVPCSASTLGKIASGIGDTLITRCAQVALKERRRLVLCLREAPLSSLALENALRLSRDGAIIMPAAPPFYHHPADLAALVDGYVSRLMQVVGLDVDFRYQSEALD